MKKEIEEKAKWLHDNYEVFAREENWNTQKSTKVEFKDLPKENKNVMLKMAALIKLDTIDIIKKELEIEISVSTAFGLRIVEYQKELEKLQEKNKEFGKWMEVYQDFINAENIGIKWHEYLKGRNDLPPMYAI